MKTIFLLALGILSIYYYDLTHCFRIHITESDIGFITKRKYLDGTNDLIFGVRNVCIRKNSQYKTVLTNFVYKILDSTSLNRPNIYFLKYNSKVEQYEKNNGFSDLDGVRFDEEFRKLKILHVSWSAIDTTKLEFYWQNSGLSKQNKTFEQLIDEVSNSK